MKSEAFEVPVPKYPWPYFVGPFAESFYEEERKWIDTDYTFMSEATRKKYKRHGLVQAASVPRIQAVGIC